MVTLVPFDANIGHSSGGGEMRFQPSIFPQSNHMNMSRVEGRGDFALETSDQHRFGMSGSLQNGGAVNASSPWAPTAGAPSTASSIWGSGNLFHQSGWTNSSVDNNSRQNSGAGKRSDLQSYVGHVQHTY